MDSNVISIGDAARKLGCDKSSLLKRLKKEGYKIGKVYDYKPTVSYESIDRGSRGSRGQRVSVIRVSDFEELVKFRKTVQW